MRGLRKKRKSLKQNTIKIDLSWRVWSLIFGFFIFVGIIGLSYAGLGNVPEMGHAVNDLQKCGPNEVLKMDSDGTSWVCDSGASGTLGCKIKTTTVGEAKEWYLLKCDTGYVLTGTAICCDGGGSESWSPEQGIVRIGSETSASGMCIKKEGSNNVQRFSIVCCKVE